MKTYSILVRVTRELQIELDSESAHAAADEAVLECAAHGEIAHREVSFANVDADEWNAEEAVAPSFWDAGGPVKKEEN